MSAADNLHPVQFNPIGYTGWKKSAAGYGHTSSVSPTGWTQNTDQQANQRGTFMAADEMSGPGHSDYQPAQYRAATSGEDVDPFAGPLEKFAPRDPSKNTAQYN